MKDIFKITKDKEKAEALFVMAKERLEIIALFSDKFPYKLVEEYYEIIKELFTSVMYLDGYKTLSHKKLLEYFTKNYDELQENELRLIDNLRKFRNDIVYYGKKISRNFLINNQKEIKKIIDKLIKIVNKKLK